MYTVVFIVVGVFDATKLELFLSEPVLKLVDLIFQEPVFLFKGLYFVFLFLTVVL